MSYWNQFSRSVSYVSEFILKPPQSKNMRRFIFFVTDVFDFFVWFNNLFATVGFEIDEMSFTKLFYIFAINMRDLNNFLVSIFYFYRVDRGRVARFLSDLFRV